MQQPDATTLFEKYQFGLCTAAELALTIDYIIYKFNANEEFSVTELDLDDLQSLICSITH